MVALVVPDAPAAASGTAPRVTSHPELSDAEYYNEVLQLPIDKSETHVEDELIARAQRLGISTSRSPNDDIDKRYTSSAQSASTGVTYHAPTFSTGSRASTSTDITVQSSIFARPDPESLLSDNVIDVHSSKDLSFAPYDKYLTQIDRNLDQPKFRRVTAPPDNEPSSKSVFSVSTKRSLFSVKSGIKNKLRWRRKSIQPFIPTV
jgi:hypothetical protein